MEEIEVSDMEVGSCQESTINSKYAFTEISTIQINQESTYQCHSIRATLVSMFAMKQKQT